jgi:hypothetical protein
MAYEILGRADARFPYLDSDGEAPTARERRTLGRGGASARPPIRPTREGLRSDSQMSERPGHGSTFDERTRVLARRTPVR